MPYISKISMTDGGGDFDFLPVSREAYRIATDEESQMAAYNASQMIQDFKQVVSSYNQKFEQDFREYTLKNSVARKMKESLNPGKRKVTLAVSLKEIQNNKKATQQFAQTMNLGHSLLLQMREVLTGQHIRTKFMIEFEGNIYQVYEDEIQDYVQLTLSRFGGQTVSNPFSLAYQLDAEVLKAAGVLREENLVDNTIPLNLADTIYGLKPGYLAEKSRQTGRQYPNIFWDSKDMEIMELLQQEALTEGYLSIDQGRYASLRKQLGGGGGYASAFYKIGDIGATQIKFFKFRNNAKVANVNFARFSLLRDRFRELERILSKSQESQILEGLKTFFTEKESNISENISQAFNKEAKEAINQWLTVT